MRKKLFILVLLLTIVSILPVIIRFAMISNDANSSVDDILGALFGTLFVIALLIPLWTLFAFHESLENSIRGPGGKTASSSIVPMLRLIAVLSIILVLVGILAPVIAILSWHFGLIDKASAFDIFWSGIICLVIGFLLTLLNQFFYDFKSDKNSKTVAGVRRRLAELERNSIGSTKSNHGK